MASRLDPRKMKIREQLIDDAKRFPRIQKNLALPPSRAQPLPSAFFRSIFESAHHRGSDGEHRPLLATRRRSAAAVASGIS